MKFTGERCILNKSGKGLEAEHLNRYKFAEKYVEDKKVLDIGCGSGYGVGLLSSKAKEILGVDISAEAIDYAKKNYSNKNIKFHIGDATNLNFLKDNEFDVVVSFELIEHIPNYCECLKEIERLLKPEGIFILSTPNKKYSSPNTEKPINPFHIIEFYLDDFKNLLYQYFPYVKLYGQSPQKKLISLYRALVPQRFRKLIFPQKIKDNYDTSQAIKFIEKNIENSIYLIAICKK